MPFYVSPQEEAELQKIESFYSDPARTKGETLRQEILAFRTMLTRPTLYMAYTYATPRERPHAPDKAQYFNLRKFAALARNPNIELQTWLQILEETQFCEIVQACVENQALPLWMMEDQSPFVSHGTNHTLYHLSRWVTKKIREVGPVWLCVYLESTDDRLLGEEDMERFHLYKKVEQPSIPQPPPEQMSFLLR